MCDCINCLLDEEVGERKEWVDKANFNRHAANNGKAHICLPCA